MAKKIYGKIFGIIFTAMAYWLLKDISFSGQNLFNNIFQAWLGYFIGYIGLSFLMSEVIEKNKILSFIYRKILFLPFIGFVYFKYIVAPLLTVIMFLGFYFLPSMWILKLGETHTIVEQFKQGIIYIISLISVLSFAYRSNVVMRYIIESFKTKLFKIYLERYTNTAFTRMYTYMIMIAIYISYNFLAFSNINLNFIPTEMLNVIKEVFVTFVAIDTLIQIILNKQLEKTREKENK